MKRRPEAPLAVPALAFGLGCALGSPPWSLAAVSPPAELRAVGVIAALVLAIAGLAFAPSRLARPALVAAFIGCGRLAGLAGERELAARPTLPAFAFGEDAAPTLVEATLLEDPRRERDGESIDIETSLIGRPARAAVLTLRIRIRNPDRRIEARAGDRIQIWAVLRRPMPARSPGGFDEETWARRARIDGFGSCKSPRLVTVVETADRSDMPAVRRLRRWIGERFAQVEGDAARAVALSMVLGDESNLPPETKDAFRASGLLHLLVVSGAQVMLLLAILRRVLPRRFRTLWRGFWIEGAVLALYGFITGGESSIARACVMAVALGLAARLDLGRHPGDGPESRGRDLSGLSLAVLVLLSVRPQDSLDTGAQLSFAAAFALVRFSPVATARLGAIGVPAVIAETAVATTLAGLATAPVLIGEFQRLPLAGFVTNLAAAPFAAILLVLSWAFVPVEPVLSAAGAAFPVEWALSALAKCLIFIAQTGAGTGLEWRTPGPGWFVWSAIVALVIGNRRRTLRRAMIAVLFAGGLTESGRRAGDGRLHVHVIDVGQGDAILVVAPDGRAGLVDAGPAFPGYDAGDRVVTPSLWAAGVSRLEFLALSHPHADHQGGAAAVARHLRPRRGVLGPGHAIPSPGDWMSVAAGNAFDLGAVRFRVLSPRGAEGARERDANARSLVFDVEWAGLSVLLLGDATEAIESRLALRGSALLVKVAHHGARRSSSKSLVEVARPLYAAVSVGRGNRFSHPDPTVLARWREVDSRIHRTDWEGSLRLATDGIRIWQATGAEPLLRPIQAAIRLDIRSGAGRRP